MHLDARSLFCKYWCDGGRPIHIWSRYLARFCRSGQLRIAFVFSPVAAPHRASTQETIIVRFFAKANLGIFLSIGLLLGKASGFFSALSSFPLSEINPLMPFIVATLLSAFSFSINVVYLVAGPWLAKGAGIAMEDAERQRSHILRKLSTSRDRSVRHPQLPTSDVDRGDDQSSDEEAGILSPDSPASTVTAFEEVDNPGGERVLGDPDDTQPLMLSQREAEEVVAKKKRVILNDIVKLGDVFWLYLLFNCASSRSSRDDENSADPGLCGRSTAVRTRGLNLFCYFGNRSSLRLFSLVRLDLEPFHAHCGESVSSSVWIR